MKINLIPFLAVILTFSFVGHFQIQAESKINSEVSTVSSSSLQGTTPKPYILWYNKPAPEIPIKYNEKTPLDTNPDDNAWENWSLPIGNGYLGANIFGRTITERVQLTDNTLASKSHYNGPGLTNFAELYIDFNHRSPVDYRRGLRLNDAVAFVQYTQGDTFYEREYFTSYPDKVMVVKLKANRKGALSFTVRPEAPYLREFGKTAGNRGRSGKVTASGNLITLSGNIEFPELQYEGQFKVIAYSGSTNAENDSNNDHGKISVANADSALILVAIGTNYKLESRIFTEKDFSKKLEGNEHPHKRLSVIIGQASLKSPLQLYNAHLKDYSNLFARVKFDLNSIPATLPTDEMLKNYKDGVIDHYLEELYFQYGRYLLICSSRPGTLPPNLQGTWSQYEVTPWTGGYWHNINIQMNYWPVFNTNLTELFQSYVDFNEAFRDEASTIATDYVKKYIPRNVSDSPEGNGWTIGTGANAYSISGPGGHSGPGTGGLTTKLFWDYYEFSGDKKLLKEHCYPALLEMSRFLSKTVIDTLGFLLASPSASPEQEVRDSSGKNHYYITTGCAFDQQMIYENHADVLKAAKMLGDKSTLLPELKIQLPRLDPVQAGSSGQIKEYREEKFYGEIGEYNHRHISNLVGLYPGTLINSNTPAWLDAARVTLNERGDQSTGWAMAHRLNLWARIKDGDRAYSLLQTLLRKGTMNNLWDTHPPFQIDGNFGGTAGIAEMLLQSHEGYIHPLAALPQSWSEGSFSGLLARGNFEVSAEWENSQASRITIHSRIGGICKLKYFNVNEAVVCKLSGEKVAIKTRKTNYVEFETSPGETYQVAAIPVYRKIAPPSSLKINNLPGSGKITLSWDASPDADTYRVYKHEDNSPDYKLIQSGVKTNSFESMILEKKKNDHCIFRVTAVDKSGRESHGVNLIVLE
jgi:alpha-L-fucosidase 2